MLHVRTKGHDRDGRFGVGRYAESASGTTKSSDKNLCGAPISSADIGKKMAAVFIDFEQNIPASLWPDWVKHVCSDCAAKMKVTQ